MPNRNKPVTSVTRPKATEDDVEGHSVRPKVTDELVRTKVSDDLMRTKDAGDEDDVEGHSMMPLGPLVARELTRARERDIQKDVKRHGFELDARDAKKDHR